MATVGTTVTTLCHRAPSGRVADRSGGLFSKRQERLRIPRLRRIRLDTIPRTSEALENASLSTCTRACTHTHEKNRHCRCSLSPANCSAASEYLPPRVISKFACTCQEACAPVHPRSECMPHSELLDHRNISVCCKLLAQRACRSDSRGMSPEGAPAANLTPSSSTRTKEVNVGGHQTSFHAIRLRNCRPPSSHPIAPDRADGDEASERRLADVVRCVVCCMLCIATRRRRIGAVPARARRLVEARIRSQ